MQQQESHPVDRIVGAVHSLLVSGGARAVSYRSVAKQAGLSAGTVTYYFASRARLLEAALDRYHDRVDATVRALVSGPRFKPSTCARELTRYVFQNRSDVRLRLASLLDGWGLPIQRRVFANRLLAKVSHYEWREDWTEEEKRIVIQGLVYAAQLFAALSAEDLEAIVGVDDYEEASDLVIETIGKLTEHLVGT
ncbi:MAG: TetR/AcrR family transcriptional regulator [Myxococcota bacterium]